MSIITFICDTNKNEDFDMDNFVYIPLEQRPEYSQICEHIDELKKELCPKINTLE